jgi:hypothetical protein
MGIRVRRNSLVSQRIEVALVYKDMLGVDEAKAYLERENIAESIAQRILGDGGRRSDSLAAPPPPLPSKPPAPFTVCRRRNQLHDAIVEAAVKVERKLGRDWALALLHDENVPDEVAARVLAEGPRLLRCKNRAPQK